MSFSRSTSQPDVLVVGAGPAGLAAAIASANKGLQVEVVDTMQPPIDKACGEGLLPDAVRSLADLGFNLNRDLRKVESHLLRGIRFHNGQATTSAQASFPTSPGRGIRRTVLHQLLLDRALALGVRFHWQNSVQGIEPTPTGHLVRTHRQTLCARYLIGADGHHSRIAAWAGLTEATIHSMRIGLRQHFTIAPWTNFVEVYWSNHGQAYVTPTSPNEVCVAFVANKKFPTVDHALTHFPSLKHHLASATRNGSPRGSITLDRTLRRITTNNIALIGDASGSVDAITGSGLGLCFRQAIALARSLHIEDLAAYERVHPDIQRPSRIMSRGLLLLDRFPHLRALTLGTFQRRPTLLEYLLHLHIGHRPGPFGILTNGLQADYTC